MEHKYEFQYEVFNDISELSEDDAAMLIKNGVICVAEGANMPSTAGAVKRFEHAKVLFAPGKASNAGGVATSGLEMSVGFSCHYSPGCSYQNYCNQL